MIFILAYITCLVTNDSWHAYDVIGFYKINHGAGRVSSFTKPEMLWLPGTVMGEGPVSFNGASNTLVG